MEKPGAGDPVGVPPGVQPWGRIGGYRLLARLGAGGMGQVYLARSDRGRTVAVKLVREELAEQEEFRARFRQEVEAARRVGGYWTAPVLDADTEAAVPWVATGYVAGPSLERVVGHDHGALPERSVWILAAGLAHALKDIHAAGIVHRDLKPSNVLVTIDGPRVIDFGIARALETSAGDGLTRTGSLVGSPGFMAPEQVRGDRITPACDVFCLGSVLAYAATGAQPFGGADSGVHALMFRIAQEEPDLERVPEGIADLIRDCLRKDPAARPSLDAVLERTGAEDTVSGGRSRDPWLPAALVAQLGRHAVQLLEVEDPQGETARSARPARPASPDGDGPAAADGPPAGAGGFGPANGPAVDAGGAGGADSGPAAAVPPPARAQWPGGGPGGAPEHGQPVRRPPAVVNGRTPPAGPATPPAYGTPGPYGHPQQYVQQHALPAAPPAASPGPYGYPQQPYHPYGGDPGSTPPYGPPPVAAGQEPERGNGRSTALLVVIALVVALGAGGSVYALMQRGGAGDDGRAGPVPTVTRASPTTSDPPAPTTPVPTSSAPSDGAVPAAYLGTWRTTIENSDGSATRELTIRQGEVGDTVLTLVADGPAAGGTYHCVFEAPLAGEPGGDGPLEIGPSTVTSGEPASSCSPGEATEVALLSDGRLRRTKAGGGESLTYTKR
ncbi:serine/threonine-protein kinase [Streptomyces sp. TG1A-8]|uniref:serine/threonine-protein kinase n=1 Tax=Streptomyces sp. TG1A-8 TaxID=3051385 RepID=UPI00265BBC95|nr:serine/threonine-protein kinase [Streptomyces sp. TG1A-8]MDO0926570.1 serine/threonine-protein kinase [Streptomyces sp. TG1A-8]